MCLSFLSDSTDECSSSISRSDTSEREHADNHERVPRSTACSVCGCRLASDGTNLLSTSPLFVTPRPPRVQEPVEDTSPCRYLGVCVEIAIITILSIAVAIGIIVILIQMKII